MKPRSWIHNLFARRQGKQRRAAARRRATVHLSLQLCEDRILPAPTLLGHHDGIDQVADNGLTGNNYFPADPSGAAASNWTIEVVNGAIEEMGPNSQDIRAPLSLRAGNDFSALKVIWDLHSDRFFAITLVTNHTNTSLITLSVSPRDDDSNFLHDGWHTYAIDATETINSRNTYADSPGLAADGTAVYITADKLDFAGGLRGLAAVDRERGEPDQRHTHPEPLQWPISGRAAGPDVPGSAHGARRRLCELFGCDSAAPHPPRGQPAEQPNLDYLRPEYRDSRQSARAPPAPRQARLP